MSASAAVRELRLLISFLVLSDGVLLLPIDHSPFSLPNLHLEASTCIGDSIAACMGMFVVGLGKVKAMVCGRRDWRHLVKGEAADERCVRIGVHEKKGQISGVTYVQKVRGSVRIVSTRDCEHARGNTGLNW